MHPRRTTCEMFRQNKSSPSISRCFTVFRVACSPRSQIGDAERRSVYESIMAKLEETRTEISARRFKEDFRLVMVNHLQLLKMDRIPDTLACDFAIGAEPVPNESLRKTTVVLANDLGTRTIPVSTRLKRPRDPGTPDRLNRRRITHAIEGRSKCPSSVRI